MTTSTDGNAVKVTPTHIVVGGCDEPGAQIPLPPSGNLGDLIRSDNPLLQGRKAPGEDQCRKAMAELGIPE